MKDLVVTDALVDSLMEDWLERDPETFTFKRKTNRLGWEKRLTGSSYSEYILSSPTMRDLIKRAYGLATDMIVVMNPPFKVQVRISPKSGSATDGRILLVSTKMFDDGELTVGEKLDAFLGTTIHEGCHLLYTDYNTLRKATKHPLIRNLWNILEDERIEQKCGMEKPGLANFLEKAKYYWFDQTHIDEWTSKKEAKQTPLVRFLNCFLNVIRYPKYLSEEDIVTYAKYLIEVKKVCVPLPKTTAGTFKAAEKIYNIILDLYKDEERRKREEERRKKKEKRDHEEEKDDGSVIVVGISSDEEPDEGSDDSDMDDVDSPMSMGSDDSFDEDTEGEDTDTEESDEESFDEDEGDGESDGDDELGDEDESDLGSGDTDEDEISEESLEEDAERAFSEDYDEISEALDEAFSPKSTLDSDDMSEDVKKDGYLLGEECTGEIEVGDGDRCFFTKATDDEVRYRQSYDKVRKFIPAISRILKGHCKEYQLVHRSMRSGVLDTNKLAEAVQGVPTVYIRHGEVTTDKVTVCVVIDESGSMHGTRISSARDTAVLINEAAGKIPNVELFIYGHTADTHGMGSTDLRIYREGSYHPKFSLGSVRAECENRDGAAILEISKRVRKFTQNPVLMFILSDGDPSASSYRGAMAKEHTRKCVEMVKKMDVHPIQVCINHSYDPAKMFDNFIILEDMNTLAFELSKHIKKAIMKMSKNRIS